MSMRGLVSLGLVLCCGAGIMAAPATADEVSVVKSCVATLDTTQYKADKEAYRKALETQAAVSAAALGIDTPTITDTQFARLDLIANTNLSESYTLNQAVIVSMQRSNEGRTLRMITANPRYDDETVKDVGGKLGMPSAITALALSSLRSVLGTSVETATLAQSVTNDYYQAAYKYAMSWGAARAAAYNNCSAEYGLQQVFTAWAFIGNPLAYEAPSPVTLEALSDTLDDRLESFMLKTSSLSSKFF
ncbi:MAG: hypothetical protein Q3962_07415 [Corynebacterium sp.]|nr:hypothetical protein [Corynebacterium sp.]